MGDLELGAIERAALLAIYEAARADEASLAREGVTVPMLTALERRGLIAAPKGDGSGWRVTDAGRNALLWSAGPNELLERVMGLAARMGYAVVPEDARELGRAVERLDEHLRGGGVLPDDWTTAKRAGE